MKKDDVKEDEDKNPDSQKGQAVQTGDQTPIMFWAFMLVFAKLGEAVRLAPGAGRFSKAVRTVRRLWPLRFRICGRGRQWTG